MTILGQELAVANLRALRRIHREYADLLTAVRSASSYIFEPAGSSIACRSVTGEWIHGPADPWEAAKSEVEKLVGENAALYVVLRPGLGYLGFAILEALEGRSSDSFVVFAEDRLDLFKATLELVDWTPLLSSNSATLLLGDPFLVLDAFLDRHSSLSLLPVVLVVPSEDAELAGSERLAQRISSHSVEYRDRVEQQLSRGLVRLEERRVANQPRRVVLAGPEFGYLSEPIAAGFRACGCGVEVHAGDADTGRTLRAHQWISDIGKLLPDIILWMNRPEISDTAIEAVRALGIATVLWSVDSPRRMKLTSRDLRMIDVHACFDAHYLGAATSASARREVQLSLGAGIQPLPGCGPTDEVRPVRCGPDVSFVGSLGESRVVELRKALRTHNPERLALLDRLASDAGDPARAFEDATGDPYEGMPCFYIDDVRAQRRRLEVLSALASKALRIYGGNEWANAPAGVASCYSGHGLRYGFELSFVYYHSKINLNVLHSQCIDSTNSRIYDVLAAGGFLLTDARQSISTEFEPGRHLVTFSTIEEARDKIAYYLTRPGEREAIAREGQRLVLQRHTLAARCRKILELVGPGVASDRHVA